MLKFDLRKFWYWCFVYLIILFMRAFCPNPGYEYGRVTGSTQTPPIHRWTIVEDMLG